MEILLCELTRVNELTNHWHDPLPDLLQEVLNGNTDLIEALIVPPLGLVAVEAPTAAL